ncbi:MAG: hypothetical protein ACRD4X_18810, partial [Candidatus Acidiferrales bacterium]
MLKPFRSITLSTAASRSTIAILDAFEIGRSRAPGLRGLAGSAGETAIVIGNERSQHGVSGIEIG